MQHLIIHRGLAKKNFKENTLNAFKYCFKKKYGVETNLHFTKDNKIICFHDFNLNRRFKINKNIKSLNYLDLKEISIKNKAEIPLLSKLLKVSRNQFPLLLELKPIFSLKNSSGISSCIPAPSPDFPSASTAPLCQIAFRASMPYSTIFLDFFPFVDAIIPTPQASCSMLFE